MKLSNIFSKNKNIKSIISSGMTKKIVPFGILIVVLSIVFVPTHAAHAYLFESFVNGALKAIAIILIEISAFVLTLSGWIFDKVVDFTIVKMAANLGGQGIGDALTTAWATLRDIANMCFIFVLLYAAFKTMFDANFSNFGKTVKDIIIVALLINFSLFFSKVVIDSSNIVAVGFYNSIANQTPSTLPNQSTGISAGYANMLGLQTFGDPKILNGLGSGAEETANIMIVGIMSSVFMLITAVILLMAGVMFAARFIILVFLMILSPLALIAYVIPGQKGKFEEWKSALIAQSFFAPVYFALTWVVFKLGNSLITVMKNDPTNATSGGWSNLVAEPKSIMGLILNYVLIIGFSIAALVISKSMASKTAVFKAISGGIGTVAIGGAALAGRNTLGRASGLISESQREKWSKSNLGRAGLWMADKGKKGSFDVRGIDTLKKVPGLGGELGIMGKAGGKGGFAAVVDTKAKAKATYAKDVYGQTGKEKEDLEKSKNDEEKSIKEKRSDKAVKTLAEAEVAEKKRKDYLDDKLKPNTENYEKIKKEKQDRERELGEAKKSGDTSKIDTAKKDVDSVTARMENERKLREEARKEIEEKDLGYKELKKVADETEKARKEAERINNKKEIGDEEYSKNVQTLKNAATERQKAYAGRLDEGLPGTRWFGRLQPNQGYKEAARKVREQAKGKSKEKKLFDDMKEAIKKDEEASGTSSPSTQPSQDKPSAEEAPAQQTPSSGGETTPNA